jgi:N-acetylglutamate synthase-like GNAT family acetyltransferase
MQLEIRPITESDRPWIQDLLQNHWGSTQVVSRGRLYQADALPGFLAGQWGQRVGLITYHLENGQCEIVSLDSLVAKQGIGTALIETVRRVAVEAGCSRLWLITTNDNLEALRFYQKRGFSLVQVHRNAIEQSRQLKPDIPLIADNGIPIRDELELELLL